MMDMTVREILTALFDDVIRGLSLFGLGMAGIYYTESSADLPVATLAELSENRESK